MGRDIHIVLELERDGVWVQNENKLFRSTQNSLEAQMVTDPFDMRLSTVFHFLCGVGSGPVPPLVRARGVPDDWNHINDDLLADYWQSYLTRDELLAYDYEQVVFYKPYGQPERNGSARACVYLGSSFMDDLRVLRGIEGNWRIVFGFDQ